MVLTYADQAALLSAGFGEQSMWAFYRITGSVFSVARHYGGMSIGGKRYAYFPESDSLVRQDIVDWLTKRDRQTARAAREAEKARWDALQGSLL